jgi:hypothetical protein
MRLDAVLGIIVAVFISSDAASSDLSTQSAETLIDSLTTIDGPIPGIDDRGTFTWFVTDAVPSFHGGLLPAHMPDVPPAFRELVRRGASALPSVLAHVDDARPTKYVVPVNPDQIFGGTVFSDEYDPRSGMRSFFDFQRNRSVEKPYVVTVGDVCFAILGTIVNRAPIPVRYQPTLIVIVNSTSESPRLVRWARRDWAGLTATAHSASLIADVGSDKWWRSDGALQRLRFYYPQAYNSLTGRARGKRNKFEAEEREQLNRDARHSD